MQRTVNDKERAYLNSLGTVAETTSTRSMARREDQSDQSLAEVKAVDDLYPLYGALVTEPALGSAELFKEINGRFGAAAPQILFDRLNLKIGDTLLVGEGRFELRAVIVDGAGRAF